MANLSGFNAANVDPEDDFAPIPAGEYVATITESVEVQNASSIGSHLKLTITILDGNYKNRKVFDRLHLNNQNQKAVEIANRRLSSICHAVGVMQPKDSNQFHDIPMVVKLAIEEDGKYTSNVIKNYKAKNQLQQQFVSPQTAVNQQPAQQPQTTDNIPF